MPQSLTPFTVAIVEDERILREELAFQLTQMGFTVQAFISVEAFYRYQAVGHQTILILDIGLETAGGHHYNADGDIMLPKIATGTEPVFPLQSDIQDQNGPVSHHLIAVEGFDGNKGLDCEPHLRELKR